MPATDTLYPAVDPAPIFEIYRGSFGSSLLTAAVAEFKVFARLAGGPKFEGDLCREMGLAPRAGNVLLVAMKAMGLLVAGGDGRLSLSALAREHLTGGAFDVSDYVAQAASSAAVREMVERLRTNLPAGHENRDGGVAYIYREGMASAMEQEDAARRHTLALAGRAKNVAPVFAEKAKLHGAKTLLDVGGGTGIYSIACLKRYPNLKAVVWDRPQVLKVAREFAEAGGVSDRLSLQPGDMFADPVPTGCDAILLSNILHDWDEPECKRILSRLALAMPAGGQLLIHDAFLNDALDGPLPVALYRANLFCLTEGRNYSVAEHRKWLTEAGLKVGAVIPTLIHCSVLFAEK